MIESLLQKKQKRSPENFLLYSRLVDIYLLTSNNTVQLNWEIILHLKKKNKFFSIPNTVINLIASPNTVIHTKTTRGATTPNLSVLLTY